MSKKGENIYKRKDGRWEGRYIKFYDKDKKAKYGYVYGKTYKAVKEKLTLKKADIPQPIELSSKNSPLYNDVLDAWLQSARINIKESTYARYSYIIDSHIRTVLGKYPISKISTQMVEGFVEQKLKSGRLCDGGSLSPKTVTDMLTIVKSTIDYARYNNLYVICNLSKLSVKKQDKEMRVLSKTEQSSLTKLLLNEMNLCKFGVLLSLYTGIRIGELCALQWEDISIELATLRIRKTMQRIRESNINATKKTKIIITAPKSKCSIREIPLSAFMMEYIKLFEGHPKAYILTGDRNKFVEPRTMQNNFKKYIDECEILNANFHCLRHTFATRCVEVGFEIKSLSEILGHSSVNITLNKYVHSSFDLKIDNMNKLPLPI